MKKDASESEKKQEKMTLHEIDLLIEKIRHRNDALQKILDFLDQDKVLKKEKSEAEKSKKRKNGV